MTTLFDELLKGEIQEDKCIDGKKHKYVEMNSYIKDGKEYKPLYCKKCKYISLGWSYI
jgi:hypothetical protein